MAQSSGPVSGEVLVKIIEVAPGAAEEGVGGMGGTPPAGPRGPVGGGAPPHNSAAGILGKFLPLIAGLSGSFGLVQLIRSSKVANELLSNVFNMLGLVVDLFIIPFLPLLIPLLRGMAAGIVGLATFLHDPIANTRKFIEQFAEQGATSWGVIVEEAKRKWETIKAVGEGVFSLAGTLIDRYVVTPFRNVIAGFKEVMVGVGVLLTGKPVQAREHFANAIDIALGMTEEQIQKQRELERQTAAATKEISILSKSLSDFSVLRYRLQNEGLLAPTGIVGKTLDKFDETFLKLFFGVSRAQTGTPGLRVVPPDMYSREPRVRVDVNINPAPKGWSYSTSVETDYARETGGPF